MSQSRVGGRTGWFYRLHPFIRTVIGLILAPVGGGTLGMLIFLAADRLFTATPFYHGDFIQTVLHGLTFGSAMGAIFGLPPSFMVGWLAHLAMHRNGAMSIPAYIVLGICLSILPGLFLAYRGINLIDYSLGLTGTLLLSGALGGIIFWLVRRPDLDPFNPLQT